MLTKISCNKITDTQPRRDHGNIDELKQSIQEVGLLNPLTVNQNYKLLAGRRRFQAITELGWEEVEVNIISSTDELFDFKVAIEENLRRKPLTDPEVAIAISEYDELKRKLEGERKAGGKGGVYTTGINGDGWTQEKTAKDLNISQKTVSQAKQITQAIKEFPELAKEKSGLMILQKARQKKQLEEWEKEAKDIPLPERKYQTIVIDPPWPVKKITREVRPNQDIELDYPTMSIEEIKQFDIKKIANFEGCHIYLWTTHRFLPAAFEVFESWGVQYECLLTWVKNVGMTPFSWMYSTEHILFGRIGNLPLLKKGLRLDFEAKVTGHSIKPDVFYELVEQVSPEPRIDVFARKTRANWDVWGDEVVSERP